MHPILKSIVGTMTTLRTEKPKPDTEKPIPSLHKQDMWARTKQALLEGSDLTHNKDGSENPTKLNLMDTMLENFHQMTLENAKYSAAGNFAALNKVLLPVMRRVIPNLLANDIIGVQPMNTMESKAQIMRGKMTPAGWAQFLTEEEPMTAKVRKLSARWTFEAAGDAKAAMGVDIEAEIMAALAQEVMAEYDCELVHMLRGLAEPPVSTYDHTIRQPDYVYDLYKAFGQMIETEAANIAVRTKRGPGNWCIVGPSSLLVLRSVVGFTPAKDDPYWTGGTKFTGTFNGINVYCDQYCKADTPVLIGYKGDETDAAAILGLYQPLTSSGVVIDPSTFEPVVSFLTNYGLLTYEKGDYVAGTKDYLGLVGFKDITSFV
jgi:hypothetical protein